ncbi:MAG: EAL domain-containing protein [Prochloraceae cyanobacterium]|nr:EAL domain-containing protein [Prochloraceae cyanobacterium]
MVVLKHLRAYTSKFFNKASLKTILIVPFVMQVSAAVGVISYLSYTNSKKTVDDLAVKLSDRATSNVKEQVLNYLDKSHLIHQSISASIESQIISLNNYSQIQNYFWQEVKNIDSLSYLYFSDRQGNFIGIQQKNDGQYFLHIRDSSTVPNRNTYLLDDRGNTTNNLITSKIYDPRVRNWYRAAEKTRLPTWSSIYSFASSNDKVLGISPVTPIYNNSGEFLGVLASDLSLGQISEFLANLKISPNAKAIIIERDGNIIATSTDSSPFKFSNSKQSRLNISESKDILVQKTAQYLLNEYGDFNKVEDLLSHFQGDDGTRNYLQVQSLKDKFGIDWLIVIAIPETDFNSTIDANTRHTIFLSIVALIVAIVTGILTSQWVAKPILKLNQAAKDIAKGDWDKTLEINRSDEVGELASSFNKMALQLKQSFSTLEQQVEKRTASLKKIAFHDRLTGLLNRTSFMNLLNEAIELTKQCDDYKFAVLFLDLDRFKIVNDSLGHLIGDRLLISVAERISQSARTQDKVARLGGDEFVILLEKIKDISQATIIAQRIVSQLQKPFYLNGYEVVVTTSIGIAWSDTVYHQADEILRDADNAMYCAKNLGKNRYELFDQTMHTQALARLENEQNLRRALELNQIEVFYQPIIDVKEDLIYGFEALARWRHPERGFISSAEFIPIAEETGTIVPLSDYILRTVCYQTRQWQEKYNRKGLTISVNISPIQFAQPNFVTKISEILQTTGFQPQDLILEITESTLIKDIDRAKLIIQELLDLNIKIALDDFGTGYSSLSYLYQLPIDKIKIDRSFVKDLECDREKLEVIRAIANLGNTLGMNLVAEGIETKQQLEIVRELNFTYGQGYLFSKPVNTESAESLIVFKEKLIEHIVREEEGKTNPDRDCD